MGTFRNCLTRAVKLSLFVFGTVTLSPSAWAQAVSLADLEGANIDVGAVHREKLSKMDSFGNSNFIRLAI